VNLYRISYAKWVGDSLHIGGSANIHKMNVIGESHGEAVSKLRRDSQPDQIEVTAIENVGTVDIG
jgi:hypothetical protein